MAAATRATVPQVNLKDRIAALQQRNASTSHPETKHLLPAPAGSLRDKIASFEKQGAVPVPRGSFGLGAPPVDDGSSKRHGEMVGNRVPGLSKPATPIPVSQLNTTAVPPEQRTPCRVSTSDLSSTSASMLHDTLSQPLAGDDDETSATSEVLLDTSPTTSPRLPSTFDPADIRTQFSTNPPPVGDPLVEGEEETPGRSEAPLAPVIVTSSEPGSDTEPNARSPSDPVPHIVVQPEHPHVDEVPQDVSLPTLSAMEPQLTRALEEMAVSTSPATSGTSLADAVIVDEASADSLPSISPASAYAVAAEETFKDEGDIASVTDRTSSGSSKPITPTDAVEFPTMDSKTIVADANSPDAIRIAPPRVTSPPMGLAIQIPSPKIPTRQRQASMGASDDDLADQSLALDSADAIIVSERARYVSPTVTRAVLVPVPLARSPVSPASSSASSSNSASPVTATSTFSTGKPFVEPSLTPKSGQKTFSAVVHRKGPEPLNLTPIASQPQPQPQPQPQSRLKPRARAPPAQPTPVQPTSAEFGDLAALLADAALLEQQLSGLGSPAAPVPVPASQSQNQSESESESESESQTLIAPAYLLSSLSPTATAYATDAFTSSPVVVPAQLEPDTPRAADSPAHTDSSIDVFHESQEFPNFSSESESACEPSSEASLESQQVQVQVQVHEIQPPQTTRTQRSGSDVQSLYEPLPPPLPAKSPRPRYFSTLLARKPGAGAMLNMPGGHPRYSVSASSETSEDDPVLVALPPTPRDAATSDAASVLSASRSLKLSKKGLSRATSFADKLWHRKDNNRSSTSLQSSTTHEDEKRLSVHGAPPRVMSPVLAPTPTPAVPRPQNPSREQRPTSWVSISSVSSAGVNAYVLDSELFDAFPSVPNAVPAVPPIPEHAQSYFLSPAGHAGSPSHTITPPPRSSSHQKQRSAML